MTNVTRFNIAKSFAAIGAVASAMLASAPAQAQAVNQSVPVELWAYRPLVITVVRSLSFGGIAISGNDGEVAIAADAAGTRTTTGDPGTPLAAGGHLPSSAIIRLSGEPDTDVLVGGDIGGAGSHARYLSCNSNCGPGAGQMGATPIRDPNLPAGEIVRLSNPGVGADGEYTFYIGGSLEFEGTGSGYYRGAFNITANYF